MVVLQAGLVRQVVVAIDGAVLVVSFILACAVRSAAIPVGGFASLFEKHLWPEGLLDEQICHSCLSIGYH